VVWQALRGTEMPDDDKPDAVFETFSARLIRREAKRRAVLELSTTSPAGLESALARISAEVTADAVDAKTKLIGVAFPTGQRPISLKP
jgi:hypothetical protein